MRYATFNRRGKLFLLLSIPNMSPLSLLYTCKRKQWRKPNPYLLVTSPNYANYSCLWNHKNDNFIIWFISFIICSRVAQTMRYERKQSKFFKLPLIWPSLRTQIWTFFLDLYCLTLPHLKNIPFNTMKICYTSSQNVYQYYFLVVLAWCIIKTQE